MKRDDDMPRLPDPDEPLADAAEEALAGSFADLVDELLAGRSLPPALPSDQRALIEVAGMVRAAAVEHELPDDRRLEVIERAFASALALPSTTPASAPPRPADAGEPAGSGGRATGPAAEDRTEPGSRAGRPGRAPGRRSWRPVLPWAVAVAASAAALLLVLERSARPVRGPAATAGPAAGSLSRRADALVGVIDPAHAADARHRIDAIYADRLASYRALALWRARQEMPR